MEEERKRKWMVSQLEGEHEIEGEEERFFWGLKALTLHVIGGGIKWPRCNQLALFCVWLSLPLCGAKVADFPVTKIKV